VQEGKFQVLTEREVLLETAELVRNIDVPLHFASDHASNYVPIEGILPRDRETIMAQLMAASQDLPNGRIRGL
jgi:hypothetical protein